MEGWKLLALVGGLVLMVSIAMVVTAKTTFGLTDYNLPMQEFDALVASGLRQRNMGVGGSIVGGFLLLVGFISKPKA